MSTAPPSLLKSPHLWIALMVIGAWVGAMVMALQGYIGGPVGIVVWIGLLTFLYTGLFITAHDAMHGLVTPGWPAVNAWIGRLCLRLFAGLNYDDLNTAHHQHHRHPSTRQDPDYHEGSGGALGWYFRFMKHYMTLESLLIVSGVFAMLWGVGVPFTRSLLFVAAPSLLSSYQLFYFGTYLTHRSGPYEGDGPYKARTLHLHPLLALLVCYNFTYHSEHHRHPYEPWWRLAGVWKKVRSPLSQS